MLKAVLDVFMRDIYDLPVRYKVLMQRAVLDVKMRDIRENDLLDVKMRDIYLSRKVAIIRDLHEGMWDLMKEKLFVHEVIGRMKVSILNWTNSTI